MQTSLINQPIYDEPQVCTAAPAPDYKEFAPETKYEKVVYKSLDAGKFARDLLRLQHKNKFTDKTCLDFISLFSQYIRGRAYSGRLYRV